jgi:hypothetical protein
MSKITPVNDYKLLVSSGELMILTEQETPGLLLPYKVNRPNSYESELVYSIQGCPGATLRQFIHRINDAKIQRSSFRRNVHIKPLDLMLRLIDLYDDLLTKNKLLSQSFINPDLIWITNDHQVKAISTLELSIVSEHSETLYWSPELVGKYNSMHFYNMSNLDDEHNVKAIQIKKQNTLARYDTRPSTMSCVYSLALVLYFIVTNQDPYVGSRPNAYARPELTMVNPLFSRLIWLATDPDIRQRPTLKDWRKLVEYSMVSSSKWLCM